jgi:PAS domain S-box-containing protein
MGRAPGPTPDLSAEPALRLLADNIGDVFWTVNTELTLTYASPGAASFLRCPIEEILRRPWTDWLTEDSLGKIATARRLAEEYLKRAPDEASPFAALDLEIVCADGARKWTETTFATLADDQGAVIGYAGVTRDVTERRRIQTWLREAYQELERQTLTRAEELRRANEQLCEEVDLRRQALQETLKSESKFRDLAEGIAEGVAVAVGGETRWANQAMADILGCRKEDLIGARGMHLFAPEEPKRAAEARGPRRAGEETPRFSESTLVRLDGRHVHVEVSARSIVFDEAPATQYVVRDITERKEAERQLIQSEKLASLGQIVAGVAHEINNPNSFIALNLPTLQIYCDAMLRAIDAAGPPERVAGMPTEAFKNDLRQMLRDMEFGSRRITRIVAELRDYARPTESRRFEPHALRPVVEKSLLLVGAELRRRVHTVDVRVEEDLPLLLMNPERIGQALVNLLINAAHAADKQESRVRVHARRDPERPGFVQIAVADNGCGIAPDLRERLFNPFVTTKKDSKGVGLGLAITKKIVAEHGGTIDVRSAHGEGAEFVLRLPAADGQT